MFEESETVVDSLGKVHWNLAKLPCPLIGLGSDWGITGDNDKHELGGISKLEWLDVPIVWLSCKGTDFSVLVKGVVQTTDAGIKGLVIVISLDFFCLGLPLCHHTGFCPPSFGTELAINWERFGPFLVLFTHNK